MSADDTDPREQDQGEDEPHALDLLPRPVVTGLIVMVSIMWVANGIIGWFDPTKSNPVISGAFMAIIGILFTRTGVARRVGRRIGRAIDGRDAAERPAAREQAPGEGDPP